VNAPKRTQNKDKENKDNDNKDKNKAKDKKTDAIQTKVPESKSKSVVCIKTFKFIVFLYIILN